MSETTLLTIAGIIFLGGPLTVIAWAIVLEWRGDSAGFEDEPGDQSHHPASIRQAQRANGRQADA